MTTIHLFEFINKLEEPVVVLHSQSKAFRTIDLKHLSKDVLDYTNLYGWIKSKNIPKFLLKNILITIINTNPPDSCKNELLGILLENE
jgi:hypothetical protein